LSDGISQEIIVLEQETLKERVSQLETFIATQNGITHTNNASNMHKEMMDSTTSPKTQSVMSLPKQAKVALGMTAYAHPLGHALIID
jgi:hypothetical protein